MEYSLRNKINELLETIETTDSNTIIVNLYDNDSNIITAEMLHKLENKKLIVNKWFNDELVYNDTYLKDGNKKWEEQCNEYMKSIEFITVHYTANINEGANANAHGKYFVNPNQPTSIHYNTGNDGVYLCLDNNKRAAHAGDSAGPVFEWLNTEVEYDEEADEEETENE